MGSSSSREAARGPEPSATTPEFTPEVVHRMCQEAYAAGAEDAGNQYMQLVDSTRRQDLAVGAMACLTTLWFAFTYGSTRVATAKASAMEHVEAQKSLLAVAHEDLARATLQVKDLTASLAMRDALLDGQRVELAKAAKLRRAMVGKMRQMKRGSTSMQRDMAHLQESVLGMRSKLYLLGLVVGLIWVETTWCLVRQGRTQQVVATGPVKQSDLGGER